MNSRQKPGGRSRGRSLGGELATDLAQPASYTIQGQHQLFRGSTPHSAI